MEDLLNRANALLSYLNAGEHPDAMPEQLATLDNNIAAAYDELREAVDVSREMHRRLAIPSTRIDAIAGRVR